LNPLESAAGKNFDGSTPRLLQIAKKRRGTGFVSARANAGSIASSIGKLSATPVPRKKLRRERAFWVEMLSDFIGCNS
jgi:hypothetical protein